MVTKILASYIRKNSKPESLHKEDMKKLLFLTGVFCAAIAKMNAQAGGFTLSAEWLYLLTGVDTPYFAIALQENTIFQGGQFANKPQWHSGVRVEAAYDFCDCYSSLRLRGTCLPQFTNSHRVTGVVATEYGLFPLESSEISAHHTVNFYNIELLYDHEIINCCPFSLSLQGGLQYAHLNFTGKYVAIPLTSGVVEDIFHSKRDGIGPEIGLEADYSICQPLSIRLSGWGALLVARNNSNWRQDSGFPVTDSHVQDDVTWKVVPATDLRLGLHFATPFTACCTSLCVDLEVGYEVLCYFHAFSQFYAFDVNNSYYDFSAHGPYAHLGVSF